MNLPYHEALQKAIKFCAEPLTAVRPGQEDLARLQELSARPQYLVREVEKLEELARQADVRH